MHDPTAIDPQAEFRLRTIDCPTCGVRHLRTLGIRGGPTHRYHLGIVSEIVQCQDCGLVFPDPFPFPVSSEKQYGDPAKYFAGHDEGRKVEAYRLLIRSLGDLVGTRNPSILDVGSGRGELLRAARLEGIEDIVGLEFAPAMIEHARTQGIELTPMTIEQYAEGASRTFDLVVLNAVLEHVHDPDSMIARVERLLRVGGLVYIDVPREPNLLTYVGNALNRLRGSRAVLNLSPTFPPFHVFGFNPKAMRRLLDKHGFQIERLEVRSGVQVTSRDQWKDRVLAFGASQVHRLANRIHLASNMYVWARKRPATPER